ncbi:type II secretion system protein J [Paraburkholderia sp. BCC1885]|uniref:PulJ/GspJ family protein n=1 Tax=Paraburkholderia sp. BCC1885 TaxID=2562669 RepID=UPI001182E7EA|nr:prepilin-type N-terminal cleavage/methylation domain-containing protein [Paraburkholderia sp. BCC1885]
MNSTSRCPGKLRIGGFTLIEMLVAIALLAIVALLSWRGLDATIRGRDDVVSNLTQTRALGRYFSQLQYDLLNLVTADEVFGSPLRIQPDELVLVRHIGVGNGPTRLQVVRYQMKAHQLLRSASQPVSTLSQLNDALQHMDRFANVAASGNVRSMDLSVWVPPVGWTSNQGVVEASYAQFLAAHGVSNTASLGKPLPRGIRFDVAIGTPPTEFIRTIPIGQ